MLNVEWKENGLLRLPFCVNDVYLTAILDTGAEISLISAEAVGTIGMEANPTRQSILLQVADKRTIQVDKTVKVNATIGRRKHEVDLIVVPGLSQNVILGVDFVREYGLNIIPGEQEMWVDGERYPLSSKHCQNRGWTLSTADELVSTLR